MQDHKLNSRTSTRKPWYQRAIEMATPWKTISKPLEIPGNKLGYTFSKSDHVSKPTRNPTPNSTLRKTVPAAADVPTTNNISIHNSRGGRLKKSASLRVATSFTRVCLCAPISPYSEVFRAEVAPRRSYSYPRSKPFPGGTTTSSIQERTASARLSTELGTTTTRRVIFRGKSLSDDVLMRRFVLEEEAMMMQIRRRNEMEVIRRRSLMRRKKLGPSPLSRMVLAEEVDESL